MHKQIKAAFTALLAALLCVLAAVPASAMSSVEPDVGVDVYGVFPQGRKSQLQLDSLALTYDIPELPADEFDASELLGRYSSTLRLDYTFSNPTDTEQSVKMMFAAANVPSYAEQSSTSAQRAALYTIELDGERITPELRHAWTSYPQSYQTGFVGYDPREYAGNLHESYAEHAFLSPDLPVTVYTYQIEPKDGFTGHMTALFNHSPDQTWVFFDRNGSVEDEGVHTRLSRYTWDGDIVKFYVLGKDPGEVSWQLRTTSDKIVYDSPTLASRETVTFGELALQYHDKNTGISESDWYNAVVAMLDFCRFEDSGVLGEKNSLDMDVTSHLQCFLTYDVTLGAGESTVNSITLPVYPDIMEYYSPKAATFTYHFHGSSDWKSVGKYTVRIDTGHKIMTDERNSVSIDNYKKDWKGYTLPERSTPKSGVYYVTLCKWKNPIETGGFVFIWFLFLFFVLPVLVAILGTVVAIVLVIVLIILVRRLIKRKAKKKAEQSPPDVQEKENEDDTQAT